MSWSTIKDELTLKLAAGPYAPTKGTQFHKAIKDYLPPAPKNFLSVGAGAGDAEIYLSQALNCPFGYQDYSSALAQVFTNRVVEQKANVLETVIGPFEKTVFKHRYDLILSFHAWYYIPITPDVMAKLRDLLHPGGRALIVLHRENNFISALNPWRGDEPLEISADRVFDAAKPFFQAQLHNWVDYWPSDAVFADGKITDNGRKRLMFLLDRDNSNFSEKELGQVYELAQSYSGPRGIKLEFGIVELAKTP
jgi:SAM-dependent methyltransferase